METQKCRQVQRARHEGHAAGGRHPRRNKNFAKRLHRTKQRIDEYIANHLKKRLKDLLHRREAVTDKREREVINATIAKERKVERQKAKDASEAALTCSGIGEWSMRKQGQAKHSTVRRLQVPADNKNPAGEK